MGNAGDVPNLHVVAGEGLPTQWAEGLPLGNGELGVMCWSDGSHLRFSLDSASAWDLRYGSGPPDFGQLTYADLRRWVADEDWDAIRAAAERRGGRDPLRPTKVSLGRLDLHCEFDANSRLTLNLEDASVRGLLPRGDGTHDLSAFVCRERDVFCLRIDPWPDGARLEFVPFYEANPPLAALEHPPVDVRERDGLTVAVQHVLPDLFLALCWNAQGPEVFVAYAHASDADSAAAEALAAHPHAEGPTHAEFFEAHSQAWREFWSASAIALPDRDDEFLWHFGLYLLASCARRGSSPPGLQGLWAMDGREPPWRGDYHADMNVQETFWSAAPGNHLDLLDVWLDYAHAVLPEVERVTRAIFGTEGAFWFCAFLPGYRPIIGSDWHPTALAWSHTGWLAQLAWLRWRYSMDRGWLAERGYPLVRSTFEFYSANLEEGADGRYHVPLSSSPEYDGPRPSAWCRDPNIDIALIRRCCDWVIEMEGALAIDELSARAREIHERLAPCHLVEFDYPSFYVRDAAPPGRNVLALWEGKPLDYSHRHPSHLMAIHPAMDLTVDGSEREREIIRASLLHYLALGQYCWAGHTYVQMVSLAAVIGEGEMAHNFLRHYRDHWTLPGGLHFNREIGWQGNTFFGGVAWERISEQAPFTIETTCGIACGIADMLLQGWGDYLRIFPAVPRAWRDALFVDLRAEGAFTVSALMRDGRVRWVRITAEVERECRLRDPFGGEALEVLGAQPREVDGLLTWPMAAGQTVTLFADGWAHPDMAQQAEAIRGGGR